MIHRSSCLPTCSKHMKCDRIAQFPNKRCAYGCFEINFYCCKMQPILQNYHSLSPLSDSTSVKLLEDIFIPFLFVTCADVILLDFHPEWLVNYFCHSPITEIPNRQIFFVSEMCLRHGALINPSLTHGNKRSIC